MLSGGRFHGDLHPGNVLLCDDGSLGLIDFGVTDKLDAFERAERAARRAAPRCAIRERETGTAAWLRCERSTGTKGEPMIGRVVAGLALVAVGVVFLLGEVGVVDAPGALVGSWWPLVFVAIGVALAVEQRRLGTGPLVFLVLGVVLLAATTDVVALDARIVWPVVLIAVGAWLLVRPGSRRSQEVEDARISATAMFEDRAVRAAAVELEQVSLTSVFGDVDLDLRDAKPSEDMTVDVTVLFGDVDVTVPADWRVVLAASSVFADVEHRPPPHPAEADAPLLRVRGFSIFGDVTVRQ